MLSSLQEEVTTTEFNLVPSITQLVLIKEMSKQLMACYQASVPAVNKGTAFILQNKGPLFSNFNLRIQNDSPFIGVLKYCSTGTRKSSRTNKI
jgi:hypothetical protein